MNPVTVTLFHGNAGWFIGILAAWGAIKVCAAAQDWLAARFAIDFNWLRVAIGPSGRKIGSGWFGWDLWIGVPRCLKIHRRWDRPGAMVNLAGGQLATVLWVTIDPDAGGMAIVQPYDCSTEQAQQPEWVPLGSLSPLPSRATDAVPAGDA
jgi:hypothetical protein